MYRLETVICIEYGDCIEYIDWRLCRMYRLEIGDCIEYMDCKDCRDCGDC